MAAKSSSLATQKIGLLKFNNSGETASTTPHHFRFTLSIRCQRTGILSSNGTSLLHRGRLNNMSRPSFPFMNWNLIPGCLTPEHLWSHGFWTMTSSSTLCSGGIYVPLNPNFVTVILATMADELNPLSSFLQQMASTLICIFPGLGCATWNQNQRMTFTPRCCKQSYFTHSQ